MEMKELELRVERGTGVEPHNKILYSWRKSAVLTLIP
jgi:hypothetical protein